jgi:hypothetical protein
MIIYLQYKYASHYGMTYETEKEQLGKLLEAFRQKEIEFEDSEDDRDSSSFPADVIESRTT